MDNNIGRKKKILIFSSAALILFGLVVGIIKISGSEKVVETAKKDIHQPVVEDKEAVAADINGEWLITDVIESSSYKSYIGLSLEFKMTFRQKDNEFTADGIKYRENKRKLPVSQRTPIFIKGIVDGNTVKADIIEHGKNRKTVGQFTWTLIDANKMVGTFTSEAANSAGSSVAIKIQNQTS